MASFAETAPDRTRCAAPAGATGLHRYGAEGGRGALTARALAGPDPADDDCVVCSASSPGDLRVFAAVLLRRLLVAGKEFSKVSPAEQHDIRGKLLACLTTKDTNAVPRPLRRSLVHCVTSVAVAGVEGPPSNSLESAWPEVLPTAGLCQPNSPVALRESGYSSRAALWRPFPTQCYHIMQRCSRSWALGSAMRDLSLTKCTCSPAGHSQFLTLLQTNSQQQPFQVFVPMHCKHCPKCDER